MEMEEQEIVKATASVFLTLTGFGANYEKMFQNAVAEVGNYGEMYERHLESILPRTEVNRINDGSTGLIYVMPFGSAQVAHLRKLKTVSFCGAVLYPIWQFLPPLMHSSDPNTVRPLH